MILSIIKVVLALSLIIIFYQDIKDRLVWWFLLPIFTLSAGILYYFKTLGEIYIMNVLTNILLLGVILGLAYVYARFKMKVNFLKEAFGLGDVLFFIGLCAAFPSISFIVFFVSCLIFSLILHYFLGNKNNYTIPLAGYASVFILFVYLADWTGLYQNLYFN